MGEASSSSFMEGPNEQGTTGIAKHILNPDDKLNFHIDHTIHYLYLENSTLLMQNSNHANYKPTVPLWSALREDKTNIKPGNALDGRRFVVNEGNGTTGLLRYNLTVTPTTTTTTKNPRINDTTKKKDIFFESNRYEVNNVEFTPLFVPPSMEHNNFPPEKHTNNKNSNNILPGIFFIFTMSDMSEIVTEPKVFGITNIFKIVVSHCFICYSNTR